MAVEAARRFNPEEGQVAQAFDVVNRLTTDATLESLQALSESQRRLVLGSYVKAAFGYFANLSGDEYLEELGTTVLNGIEDGRINLVLTRSTHETIDELYKVEAENQMIKPHYGDQDIIFLKRDEFVGMGEAESAIFVVPVGFVLEARDNAVGTLADLSSYMSQMQDFVHGRYNHATLPIAQAKMNATRAHFLRHAQGQNQQLEFSYSNRQLLQRFPNSTALSGLRSLQARK